MPDRTPLASLPPEARAAAIWLSVASLHRALVVDVDDLFPGQVAVLEAARIVRVDEPVFPCAFAKVEMTRAGLFAVAVWLAGVEA